MVRPAYSSFMYLIWLASYWIVVATSSSSVPIADAITVMDLGRAGTNASLCNMLRGTLGRAGTNASLCNMLRGTFDDPDIVFCDTKTYKFDFGNPTCNSLGPSLSVVVRPNTAKEVAAAILVARDTNTPLSVRGGGHSYACNAVRANSIHIDLRSLNAKAIVDNDIDQVPYPGEEKLLKVGGGTRFVDIFEILNRDEYSVVHPDGYTVGVGGFYLHGGLNLPSLTKRYGYGNETIRALELVTADGQILRFREAHPSPSQYCW
jgi:FAD binding domain